MDLESLCALVIVGDRVGREPGCKLKVTVVSGVLDFGIATETYLKAGIFIKKRGSLHKVGREGGEDWITV